MDEDEDEDGSVISEHDSDTQNSEEEEERSHHFIECSDLARKLDKFFTTISLNKLCISVYSIHHYFFEIQLQR